MVTALPCPAAGEEARSRGEEEGGEETKNQEQE